MYGWEEKQKLAKTNTSHNLFCLKKCSKSTFAFLSGTVRGKLRGMLKNRGSDIKDGDV